MRQLAASPRTRHAYAGTRASIASYLKVGWGEGEG